MSHAEFAAFCTAIANSFAHQASVLQEKAVELEHDEYAKKHHIEERIEILTDQMEAWAAAPRWYKGGR